MVDDAVDDEGLDVVAVLLQIGRGVEGAVGTGIGDEAVVLPQGLPDLLDVSRRIYGRQVIHQLAGPRKTALGEGDAGVSELLELSSRHHTVQGSRAGVRQLSRHAAYGAALPDAAGVVGDHVIGLPEFVEMEDGTQDSELSTGSGNADPRSAGDDEQRAEAPAGVESRQAAKTQIQSRAVRLCRVDRHRKPGTLRIRHIGALL